MARLTEILNLAQQRAQQMALPYEGALTPKEAAEVLTLTSNAKLVDVRTRAELDWVGRIPGALEVEWLGYPGNVPNAQFMPQLKHSVSSEAMLLFICRSGARSNAAAKAASDAGFADCYNVLEGFEGDKDGEGHRGTINGWRFHGLPWTQG
jgi:rhodanese-related sulfurtransferase